MWCWARAKTWAEAAEEPTNGEGSDAATLELTGLQEELVKAVQATGTPTVAVLINGRALAVRWVAKNVPAVVEAWLPGEKGGTAVAEVLFGDINPSGKTLGDDSPPRRPVARLLQLQEVETLLVAGGLGTCNTSTWSQRRCIPSVTG